MAESYSMVYISHILYPFICQWTLRLLPCLGYCEQCCYEHCGACIFKSWFSANVCSGLGLVDHMVVLFLVLEPTVFSKRVVQICIPTKSVGGVSFLQTHFSNFICRLFDDGRSFAMQKLIGVIRSYLFIFDFISFILGD